MIAITGTPGCGKTTLAGLLRADGRRVADVKTLAEEQGAVAGHDALDDADVVDVDALTIPEVDFVEGHLAHLLPCDAIWVIRCDPVKLEARMAARGYGHEKIRENLEAEAMDLILQEALDAGVPVIQRDGTQRTPKALLSAFAEVEPASLNSHDIEPVDWSDWLLG